MSKRRAETNLDAGSKPSENGKAEKIKAKLICLNTQFSLWVKTQSEAAADKVWVDGARDYIKHAEELVQEYEEALGTQESLSKQPSKPSFGGLPEPSVPKVPDSGAEKPVPLFPALAMAVPATGSAPMFSFGVPAANPPSNGASDPAGSSDFAATTSAPRFNFGTSSGFSSPTTGFSFNATGGAPGGGIFGFGAGASAQSFGAAATGTTGGEEGAGEDEEAREAEKPVDEFANLTGLQADETTKVYFKSKSKFFYWLQTDDKEGKWAERGVGFLSVRALSDGTSKPFISFTTEAGRSLYTTTIHKSMKCIVCPTNVMFSAPWKADPGAEVQLHKVTFKMAPSRSAEFEKAIVKVQEAM